MPGLEKELMMKELAAKIKGCAYLFLAGFQNLSVNEFSALRRVMEKTAKSCFVTKKTLLEKLFETSGLPKMNGALKGSVVLIAAEKDPQIIAKALFDFAKGKPQGLEVACAVLDGKALDANFVKELSKLPSRNELLAKLLGGMKSPISGFVLTLNGVLRSLVCVLNEVSKKKGSEA